MRTRTHGGATRRQPGVVRTTVWPRRDHPMVRITAGVQIGPPQPLVVVPRRRRTARVVAVAFGVIFALMLVAAAFQTQLASRQVALDKVERSIRDANQEYNDLRRQRSELRAPERLATAAEALGMRPSSSTEFVSIDPQIVALVQQTSGGVFDTNAEATRSARRVQPGQVDRRIGPVSRAPEHRRSAVGGKKIREHGAPKRPRAATTTAPRTSSSASASATRRRGAAPAASANAASTDRRDRARPEHSRPLTKRGPASRRAGAPVPSARPTAKPSATRAPRPTRGAPALQRRAIRRPRAIVHHFKAGESRRRMRILFAVSAALCFAVIGRVTLLQTAQAAGLVEAGRAQRTSETVLRAARGTIFDRNGVELALSVPKKTIIANPKLVADAAGTAATLGQLLGLPDVKTAALQVAFADKSKSFVYVARQIDASLASTVLALKLAGIAAIDEDQRVLPSGDVGLAVVGRTDIDGLGTAGVEKAYDEQLTGTDGQRVREHDNQGRSIPGEDATTTAPVPGDDLQLTIDRSLQYQTEQALLAGINRPDVLAKGAKAVVLDTKTGEILAMANVDRGDDGVARVTSANKAMVEANEPGSVAKLFSISASINEGVTSPDTTISVPPYLTFNQGTKWEQRVFDAESHDTGPMSLSTILAESSNIGTYLTVHQIGVTKLTDYLHTYGFGAPTGVGFPGESTGAVSDPNKLQGTEKVTITYGYRYTATTVQLAAATNTIANGGVYVAPKLVKATIGADGKLVDTPPSATHVVTSPTTAADMTQMMLGVTCSKLGTAYGAFSANQMNGISVAGKTGTAFKVQKNGTYTADDGTKSYFASFVGFYPAAAPRVTIVVSVDEPDPTSNARFGGTGAAPIFVDIAQAATHEVQITPPAGDVGCNPSGK